MKKKPNGELQQGDSFRNIIESTPYLIAISEGDKIKYINRAGSKLLGMDNADEIVGKSFMEFIHPSQWAEITQKIDNLMNSNEAILRSEMSFLRRDDTLVDIEFSVIPMSEGKPNHFQIIAQDITTRKQEQMILQRVAALAEIEYGFFEFIELPTIIDRIAQSAFSLINNNGGISILIWNEDDQVFTLEKTWSNIPEQAEIDKTLCAKGSISYQIINDRQPLIALDVQSDSSDLGYLLQTLNIQSYAGVPLRVEDECMGVLFAFGKLGNLYFEKNLDLIISIANRATHSIRRAKLYEQLQKAKEIAEDTAKTNTLILAESSHELRSPLARIIYLAEMLLGTKLSSAQSEYLKGINTAAEKLLYLIGDILDFTKIKASKFKLEPRSFDLRERIEECLNLNSAVAENKDISLAYWVDPSIPQFVFGDPNRIEQVLNNLVTNSVKFTPWGFISLTVSIKEPTQNQQTAPSSFINNLNNLLFSVKDTGIGIPVNRQQNLFKAFSRVNDPAKGTYDGSGLGLAICKQLVDIMGGEIWVESSGVTGEGSDFKFTLPIQLVKDVPLGEHLRDVHLPLKDKSVIVISNNEANRQMLSNWLSYWGMRIKTCESTINHEQFDMIVSNELVILDLYGLQENAQLLLEILQTKNISQPDSVIVYGSKPQTLKLAKYFPEKNFLKTPFKALSFYSLLRDIYALPPDSPEYKLKKITAQNEQSINILVADDDPTLLKALTMQLRNWGFIFDVVKDGYQVLHAVQQKNYHVILIDLFMPGMDGLEATHRIREILPGERQPFIIMLTADSQVDTQAEMVAAGVNTVLVKPIKGDVLKNTLAQINEQLGNSLVQPSTSPKQALALNLQNVIDQEILLDFHQALGLESKQALSELINSYLENTPKLLVDMDRALGINDWDQLKWAAHALKGNSELFGARNLSQLCQKLVADITHNILDNVTIQTRMINNEYQRVFEFLESMRENISRNPLDMIID